MINDKRFKKEFTFEQRFAESTRAFARHPDKVPIICERSLKASSDCPNIDRKKYLVSTDCTVGQFLCVIRKQLHLPPGKGLFLFVNNTIPPTITQIKEIYAKHKDIDGFLYVTYLQENTFG